MAAEIHQEGLQYLLECSISEEQTPPANLYVGICTDASLDEAEGLVDISGEWSGNGYARQAVATSAAATTSATAGTNDWRMTLDEVTFTASGGSLSSGATWFVCTVATGTAGKLLASGPLSTSRTLADGEILNVTAYLQLNG